MPITGKDDRIIPERNTGNSEHFAWQETGWKISGESLWLDKSFGA